MSNKIAKVLRQLEACSKARTKTEAYTSFSEAWEGWYDGDELLWLLSQPPFVARLDPKLFVRCAAECARLVLKYVPKGEDRPLQAIEAALRWCDGEATIEEVDAATTAAWAAIGTAAWAAAAWDAGAAARAAAWNTARAAARAARSAIKDAAWAAGSAERAVWYPTDAAGDTSDATRAVYDAAVLALLKDCADVIRGIVPFEQVAAIWQELESVLPKA